MTGSRRTRLRRLWNWQMKKRTGVKWTWASVSVSHHAMVPYFLTFFAKEYAMNVKFNLGERKEV